MTPLKRKKRRARGIKQRKRTSSASMPTTEAPEVSADELDILDWDFALDPPPGRPTGTVRAVLHYIGPSEPSSTGE